MSIFITGTDTGVGKTTVASWLCLHTKWPYFKPIQTGTEVDSTTVAYAANCRIYPERFVYKAQAAPSISASLEQKKIDFADITLPKERVIVEGAGGLLVPIDEKHFMIDLIKAFDIAVILVASGRLGTINHTLLSLECLKLRNITTLGVIISGDIDKNVYQAIESYGNTTILAQLPTLTKEKKLQDIALTKNLQNIFAQ
jgi:dethiobiotin synthetase